LNTQSFGFKQAIPSNYWLRKTADRRQIAQTLYVSVIRYNTYVTTKLTLSLDPAVITRAKRYARQRGVSVSAMVETYLAAVSQPADEAKAPQVRGRLQGILKGANAADYRRHLERKYK